MPTPAELRARVVNDVLDSHEQLLYLRHKAGKSLHALAQLYRQYEGENGVQEALNKIHGKVEEALRSRVTGTSAADVVRKQIAADEDDGLGGLPIRTRTPSRRPVRPPSRTSGGGGLNGTHRANLARSKDGAGAAGEPRATPPIQPAPARPSDGRPSSPILDTPASSPSRAPRAAGEPRRSGFAAEAVLEALEGGPKIPSEIGAAVTFSKASVCRALALLEEQGRVIDTRFRRVGPLGGKPSKVWGLPGAEMAPHLGTAPATFPLVDMPSGAARNSEEPLTRREVLDLISAGRQECERAFKRLESLLKIG